MNGPSASAFNYGGGFSGNQTVVDTVPPEMLHLVDPHWSVQQQPTKFNLEFFFTDNFLMQKVKSSRPKQELY